MTAQVYSIFIKASAERVWEAIVDPAFTERYFHGVTIEITPEVRRSFRGGELRSEVEVLEYEPPRRLVHAWVSYYDPELAAEEPSRVTWELEQQEDHERRHARDLAESARISHCRLRQRISARFAIRPRSRLRRLRRSFQRTRSWAGDAGAGAFGDAHRGGGAEVAAVSRCERAVVLLDSPV